MLNGEKNVCAILSMGLPQKLFLEDFYASHAPTRLELVAFCFQMFIAVAYAWFTWTIIASKVQHYPIHPMRVEIDRIDRARLRARGVECFVFNIISAICLLSPHSLLQRVALLVQGLINVYHIV